MTVRPNWLASLVIATSLGGCSLRPPLPPVVVPCPKPVVDRELLLPAEHQAMDALQDYLGMPSTNAAGTPGVSTPPPPK